MAGFRLVYVCATMTRLCRVCFLASLHCLVDTKLVMCTMLCFCLPIQEIWSPEQYGEFSTLTHLQNLGNNCRVETGGCKMGKLPNCVRLRLAKSADMMFRVSNQ